MARPVVFFTDGALAQAKCYSNDFPLKQTQSLLLALDEIEAWVIHAQKHFGDESLPSLDEHKAWLSMVENHVLDVRYVLDGGDDSDEDDDLYSQRTIACRLNADDSLVESLETVIHFCPDTDAILDKKISKPLANTLASLTNFWIDQIHDLLTRLLAIITGDGEVLAILKRQELLAKLYF